MAVALLRKDKTNTSRTRISCCCATELVLTERSIYHDIISRHRPDSLFRWSLNIQREQYLSGKKVAGYFYNEVRAWCHEEIPLWATNPRKSLGASNKAFCFLLYCLACSGFVGRHYPLARVKSVYLYRYLRVKSYEVSHAIFVEKKDKFY